MNAFYPVGVMLRSSNILPPQVVNMLVERKRGGEKGEAIFERKKKEEMGERLPFTSNLS